MSMEKGYVPAAKYALLGNPEQLHLTSLSIVIPPISLDFSFHPAESHCAFTEVGANDRPEMANGEFYVW